MVIRNLSLSDVAAVQEILREWRFLWKGNNPQFSWNENSLRDEIEINQSLGLFSKEQLIAFMTYQHIPPVVEIRCLVTHPVHQGAGFMKTLLESFIRDQSGEREIWLEVHENNARAKALYEGLGFEICGRRSLYYSDKAAALLYKKTRLDSSY